MCPDAFRLEAGDDRKALEAWDKLHEAFQDMDTGKNNYGEVADRMDISMILNSEHVRSLYFPLLNEHLFPVSQHGFAFRTSLFRISHVHFPRNTADVAYDPADADNVVAAVEEDVQEASSDAQWMARF